MYRDRALVKNMEVVYRDPFKKSLRRQCYGNLQTEKKALNDFLEQIATKRSAETFSGQHASARKHTAKIVSVARGDNYTTKIKIQFKNIGSRMHVKEEVNEVRRK